MRTTKNIGFRKGKAVNSLFQLNTVGERVNPVCEGCAKPIPDVRFLANCGPNVRFCSNRCAKHTRGITSGRVAGTGRIGRLKPFYDQARSANGEWIEIQATSTTDADSIVASARNNAGGFDARRNGLIVLIRKVVA